MSGATKSAREIERLLEEYESLARRQYEALQKSSYAQMARRESAAYDVRFLRIQEISKEIVRLRSEGS
jgi:molybdenum-dependent DNA-binding transcriptional regulator ModE